MTSPKKLMVCGEEIIDLTGDEPPVEFTILMDIPSDDDKDSKIAIIENNCVGYDINTKQVANAGGGESGNEHEYKDGEVLDNDDGSLQLDCISR